MRWKQINWIELNWIDSNSVCHQCFVSSSTCVSSTSLPAVDSKILVCHQCLISIRCHQQSTVDGNYISMTSIPSSAAESHDNSTTNVSSRSNQEKLQVPTMCIILLPWIQPSLSQNLNLFSISVTEVIWAYCVAKKSRRVFSGF